MAVVVPTLSPVIAVEPCLVLARWRHVRKASSDMFCGTISVGAFGRLIGF